MSDKNTHTSTTKHTFPVELPLLMINLYSRTVQTFFSQFLFSEQVETQAILKAAKQGGRRNATEKQQVMLA